MTTVMTTQTTLTIMKLTTTTMKQTGLLLIMTMLMKKRILIMTAKDQPDGQNGEISEELAAPIRNIARTGSSAAEKLTTFILRPAPVLMSAIILAITFFSFWNQLSDYGDINTLTSNPDLTLIAYLTVGAVMLIWMLSTFFFTLSGIRHGTGRGLTYFVLVYVLSYLFSLAAAAIPADVQLLTGIRGGILVFGSLYPAYFPFCVVGIITCILRKILK